MKNKLIIASILGAWVMTIGMTTYAYQWNPGIMNPNCTDTERQAAVQEMFKNEIMSLSKLYAEKWVMRRIDSAEKFKNL